MTTIEPSARALVGEPPPRAKARARLRPLVVAAHRYVGLAMAAFLIVAGLTGALLAFEKELDAALNPGLYRVADTGAPDLSPDAIAAAAEAAFPEARALYVQLQRAPGESVTVYLTPRDGERPLAVDQAFVDPATGDVLGARLWGAARIDPPHLMPFIYKLHYSLWLPGSFGLWFMGLLGLVWAIDSVAGWWLSFPRGVTLREAFGVRWRSGPFKLHFDLHRATGLWLWPVLIALALTGTALNLHGELFRPLMAQISPITPFYSDTRTPLPEPLDAPLLSFSRAVEAATAAAPAHFAKIRHVEDVDYWPEFGLYRVGFLTAADVDREYGRSRLWIDATTGAVAHAEAPLRGSAGDVVDAWLFPLHAGTFAGLSGRIFVAFAGLATAALSVTGVMIWARKRAARARRGAMLAGSGR